MYVIENREFFVMLKKADFFACLAELLPKENPWKIISVAEIDTLCKIEMCDFHTFLEDICD